MGEPTRIGMHHLVRQFRRNLEAKGEPLPPLSPERRSSLGERPVMVLDTRGSTPLYRRHIERRWKPYVKATVDDIPGLKAALVQAYRQRKGLYLYGGTGTGKTHALVAIYDRLNSRLWKHYHDGYVRRDTFAAVADGDLGGRWVTPPYEVVITSYMDLLDALRQDMRSGRDEAAGAFSSTAYFRSVRVLLIDDVAAGRITAWQSGELYELLNARLNEGNITHFASNYDPVRIKDVLNEVYDRDGGGIVTTRDGDRFSSRIFQACLPIELGGADRRLL